MKVYDMPQKSESWFEIKYGKVGGSSADKLTTPAKFKSLKFDLISQKLEPFVFDEDEANKFLSKAVDRGNELERPAREYLAEFVGVPYQDAGWIQSDIPVLGISPDGVSAGLSQSCEIKCPSAAVHTEYIMGGEKIPAKYFWQNIAYFAVIDTEELEHRFISFRPECSIEAHIITLNRDTVTQFGQSKKTVRQWVEILRDAAWKMRDEIEEAVDEINKRKF